MRSNKGLHRGVEEIALIIRTILQPTREAMRDLNKELGHLYLAESQHWEKVMATADPSPEMDALRAEQYRRHERIKAVYAELDRKAKLEHVFSQLVACRATEVTERYKDSALRAALTHGEGLLLKDIEQYAYA